jgi:asparagine synthase (glutamine-hydrolysing)
MCGISAILGKNSPQSQIDLMVRTQQHRGPDDQGIYISPDGMISLGHNRLSILDLSTAGHQPMQSADGHMWIVFNGEIYNYVELRAQLADYPFQSNTDTEIILAAYQRWGTGCLEHFVGMFAFILWDEIRQEIFAARDRFGVKPLYFHHALDGTLYLASEIKTLHASGIAKTPNTRVWSTYLSSAVYDHSQQTFWEGIEVLPAGNMLRWQNGHVKISPWYDLSAQLTEIDMRPVAEIQDEYLALMEDSVRLRFRSDVPVGINLSGGLDSSTLLSLVQRVQGNDSNAKVYTFVTGSPDYDELPWVRQMLAGTQHPLVICRLYPEDIPLLACSVQRFQDEPFGGLPTLAYARLFEYAKEDGTIVLLDGQGMDEQWAGYDYYNVSIEVTQSIGTIQGTKEKSFKSECLTPEFRSLTQPFETTTLFNDPVLNLQYRDIRYTKIPRALRFNDRISMRCSTELREPFLDHRLFELALRQPVDHKIRDGQQKWLLRQIGNTILPHGVIEAPKRPLQTPQREWLRGPLRLWAEEHIENMLESYGKTWFDADKVRESWRQYCQGAGDNSFYVWQWISLSLIEQMDRAA